MKTYGFLLKGIVLTVTLLFLSNTDIMSQNKEVKKFLDNTKDLDSLLSLTIVGNGYSDQTLIYFYYPSTEGFDSEYDAYKLNGIYAAPQLYSIIECCNLAVNVLPTFTTNYSVQLGLRVGADTDYTITANGISTFDPSTTVYLVDSRDKVVINLNVDSVYTFNAKPGECRKRFRVYFDMTSKFLSLKTFLEGAFAGGEMDTTLQHLDLIPPAQPFNTSPWNYTGSESVTSVPKGVVDWVLVEIRDAANAVSATSSTVIARQAAFLMMDGSIKYIDACSLLDFDISISQNMFVVLYHRNHAGIMSRSALTQTSGVYQYDFTTSSSQIYGGELGCKELALGVWGMISGDGDGNGEINNVDKDDVWWPVYTNSGYLSGDFNLDGIADDNDLNYWDPNSGKGCQVPE